jgi:adenosylhomocysteine nucleosidase
MININSETTYPLENILFSFALESEAADVFEGQNVVFTGIGKVNAAYELTKVIHQQKPALIVNLGTAGSNYFAKGEVICCTKFVQRDMDAWFRISIVRNTAFGRTSIIGIWSGDGRT